MTLLLIIGLIYMDYMFFNSLRSFEGAFGLPQWLMVAGMILSVPLLVYLGIRAYKENKEQKAKREEEMKKEQEERQKKRQAIFDADFDRNSDPDSPDFNLDPPAEDLDELPEDGDSLLLQEAENPDEPYVVPKISGGSKFDE